MIRPINRYSYIDQSGSVTPTEAKGWSRLRIALSTLTSIAGVIGLPIVSCLLARGAVVYTQRRSANQTLSVLQLFMLADRQWLNPAFLLKRQDNSKRHMGPIYFWLAAGLILISEFGNPWTIFSQSHESLLISWGSRYATTLSSDTCSGRENQPYYM
jgi:hypothetical protein